MTDEELAKIKARHVRSSWGFCLLDEQSWPCSGVQVIEALREAYAEIDRLRECLEESYQANRTR